MIMIEKKPKRVPKYLLLRDSIVSAYVGGATMQEVAAQHAVSPGTVQGALKAAGVPRRHQGTRNQHERNDQIAEMRRSGRTLEEIGERYGLTRERVRQILLRLKVTPAWHRSAAVIKRREDFCRADAELARDLYRRYQVLGTAVAVARETGRGARTVYFILKRNGFAIDRSPMKGSKRDFYARVVEQFARTDKTIEELAAEFGMKPASLRTRLHQMGWTMRRRKVERARQDAA